MIYSIYCWIRLTSLCLRHGNQSNLSGSTVLRWLALELTIQRPSFTSAISVEHACYKHCSDEIRAQCNHKLMSLPKQSASVGHCCGLAKALNWSSKPWLLSLHTVLLRTNFNLFLSNLLSAQSCSCLCQGLSAQRWVWLRSYCLALSSALTVQEQLYKLIELPAKGLSPGEKSSFKIHYFHL